MPLLSGGREGTFTLGISAAATGRAGPQREIFPGGAKIDAGPPKLDDEQKKKVFTQICPKSGEEQKKIVTQIFCRKLGEEQKKVFTQIWSHFLPKIR